jgi:hypothetical protein
MASANKYDMVMREILQAINTLPAHLCEEGHALWRSEGCQAVARWADLLPYTDTLHPGDVAAAQEIAYLCIRLNGYIEEDCA